MYKHAPTLTDFILKEEQKFKDSTGSFTLLLTYLENAVKLIASHIKLSGLADVLGATGTRNTFDEEVQKLDELSNNILTRTLLESGQVYAVMSEELEKPLYARNKKGKYVIFIDPLDGSSNLDVNISVGTIFSIYKKTSTLLQKGLRQVAAGYVLYGSSVMFVYTCGCGNGVNGFTLDPAVGNFLLSHPKITVPKKGSIYSINEAYYDKYHPSVQKYLDAQKKKNSKARYVGSMVVDIHRTLLKGGIFIYPDDKKNPDGKLRLMYEVNPLSFIMQEAGGRAVSKNMENPLNFSPKKLHQRVPIALGSAENVEEFRLYAGGITANRER